MLDLPGRWLLLAAGFLGSLPAGLDVDHALLHLDPRRLRVCRWLLGSRLPPSRSAVCSGVCECALFWAAELGLSAALCDSGRPAPSGLLCASDFQSLLLRRFLR